MSEAVSASIPSDKPKPYVLGPEAGGRMPDVSKLLSETMEEFKDNFAPYLLAGLGQMVVALPVILVTIFVGYFVVFGGMMGLSFGGILVGAAIGEAVSQDIGGIVALLAQLAAVTVPFALFFGVLGLGLALLAPLNASLLRAVAAHQRGEKTLDFGSTFSTATQDLVRVIGIGLVMSMLVMVGLMMCYLPAMAVPLLFGFATPLVALHRRAPIEATRTALGHVLAHPQPHLMLGLITLVMTMFAGYLPVIGPMFVLAFHIRAHRQIFGDGAEPVLVLSEG